MSYLGVNVPSPTQAIVEGAKVATEAWAFLERYGSSSLIRRNPTMEEAVALLATTVQKLDGAVLALVNLQEKPPRTVEDIRADWRKETGMEQTP